MDTIISIGFVNEALNFFFRWSLIFIFIFYILFSLLMLIYKLMHCDSKNRYDDIFPVMFLSIINTLNVICALYVFGIIKLSH